MYRIGIVGLGVIYHQYIQALVVTKDVFYLVAVCDKDETRLSQGLRLARETLKRDDIQGSTDLTDFLTAKMDIVFIATPPSTHYPLAMECIRANKSLLVEKPAMCRVDNLVEIHEFCSVNALQLHTAFHSAYAADVLWFLSHRQELEQQHGLGEAIEISCGFSDPYVIKGQVLSGRENLGGSYLDSGVNELSVIAQLVDISSFNVKEHHAELLPDSKITCKSYTELVEAQGKLVIKMETDWTLGKNEKTTCIKYGNGSSIILNHSMQTVILSQDNQQWLLFDNGDKPRLLTQYINMLKHYAMMMDAHHSNYDMSLQIHNLLLSCSNN